MLACMDTAAKKFCGEDSDISIGVVIPTFERVVETLAAIASVLEQTTPAQQIVVVDDGSSYDVQRNLKDGLKDLPLDLVLAQHSGHPGRVRNIGLGQLATSHVAFLDSDDTWIPRKLEIQRTLAGNGWRAQGSSYTTTALISNQNHLHFSVRALTLKSLLKVNRLCTSSVVIDRDLLDYVGGLPVSYGVRGIEDYATWLRVASVCDWALVSKPLVVYSDNPAISMRGTNFFSVSEQTLALWEFVAWLEARGHRRPRDQALLSKISEERLKLWAASRRG